MSEPETSQDHLHTIKEDPKDFEDLKQQSPSRGKNKWNLRNIHYPVSNTEEENQEDNDLRPISRIVTQEGVEEPPSKSWSPSQKREAELSGQSLEIENILKAERKKLALIFQQEMQEKLTELDRRLNEYWEKKYEEIEASYEKKISQYEELLEAAQGETAEAFQGEIAARLEKEISEKYQQQYLDKIEEIQQNFKAIEEENLYQIVDEIKKELETQYEEKFNRQVAAMREEAKQEIERHKSELNTRRNNNEDQDEFQKMLEIDVKSSIERNLREKYEQEKEAIIRKYMQEQEALKREINMMESKVKEKLEAEVEEELKKELSKKEKLMNLNWRKKMEAYKKSLEDNLEQEMRAKLENERKEIEKAKIELRSGRMKSLENVRLKKAEDSKKAIENKLKEQEESYQKVINNLKKQIEDLKNAQSNDEEKLSLTTKREDGRDLRSASSSRPGRQQAKSLTNSKILDANNKSKQDSFIAEGFYKPEASNPHSPLYEKPREKSPMSPPRRDLFEDKSLDKFFPGKSAYTQPISTLRNRADRHGYEEPNKIIQDIIDPMAPPELLSQEHLEFTDVLSQEKEFSNEEKKLPLLKQEGGSSYDNLKAEIMKKYSPKKISENVMKTFGNSQSNMEMENNTERLPDANTTQLSTKFLITEGPEEGQGLRTHITTQRAPLTGTNEDLQRDSVSLNNSMHKKDDNKEEESFQKKYEAILRKYNKENFTKDKYQASNSEKGNFYKEGETKSNDKVKKNKYQMLFEIKNDDDQKTKDMKKLKKTIEDTFEKDNGLESKYLAREIYLTTDFLTKLDIETTGQQKTLKNSLKALYDLWNDIETSYQARLNFMDSLELIPEYENLMKKISLEIDYLKVTQRNIGEIIGHLKKRNYYKEQINYENFDYKKYKKLYFAIDSNNIDIKKQLESYKRKYNKDLLYKGAEVSEIIRLDSWENEYLQKIELKEEIMEKIRKKL